MKLKEIRTISIKKLQNVNNTSPHTDVDLCLISLLGISKTEIIIGEREINPAEQEIIENAVSRIELGEPVQYVVGSCEFMSLNFRVNSSTLIPRADTEILVERVIDFCRETGKNRILEIGCGSGCISASLAHYLSDVKIFAIDISPDALKMSAENAKLLGVSHKIEFFNYDIMQGFPEIEGGVDVVVSNPPYIPSFEIAELEKKVKNFEPRTALDGGDDGLDFYRQIAGCAKINQGGLIAFEVGYNQADAVSRILLSRGCKSTELTKDLSGIDRVVSGRF